jgi:hypothetical protein
MISLGLKELDQRKTGCCCSSGLKLLGKRQTIDILINEEDLLLAQYFKGRV